MNRFSKIFTRQFAPASYFISLVIVGLSQPHDFRFAGLLTSCVGFSLFWLSKPRLIASAIWMALVSLFQLRWMSAKEFQGDYILVLWVILALVLGICFALYTKL